LKQQHLKQIFLSEALRNAWIEKGSDDYEKISYFTKMDGSDEMTRLGGRKINRTLHKKMCTAVHIFVHADKGREAENIKSFKQQYLEEIFLSETLRNTWIEAGSGGPKKMQYFRKIDGSDKMGRIYEE